MSNFRKLISVVFAGTIALSACSSDSPLSPDQELTAYGRGDRGQGSGSAQARVRCEVRPGRSKVSVDGKNLSPAGGSFSARIRSGAHTASAASVSAVGDEAEFDFDSYANDVAAGATAIAADFIVLGSGADVTAEILNTSGTVVAAGGADCTVN